VRTTRNLFPRLVSEDFLEEAAERTTRGKRRRCDVARFLFRREEILERLRSALSDGTWRPDGFRVRCLQDPKPRAIAHSTVEDRVVHAALACLLEPVLSRSLLPDTFACRAGFGTHRASLRVQELLGLHRFAVHLDIRCFFPSVDLEILQALLAARIRDPPFLDVLSRVLEAGRGLYDPAPIRAFAGFTPDWPPPRQGLPIGAWTSQILASHLYLDALDHHVKRDLKVPGYVRYCDDILLFGDRRADLRTWRSAVGAWLENERRVRLKHPQARILACAGHLDALGLRITRDLVRPRARALRRLRATVGQHMRGVAGVDVQRSLASRLGSWMFP